MHITPLTQTDIQQAVELEQQANQFPWSYTAFSSSFSNGYFSYKLTDEMGSLTGFYVGYQLFEQAELFNICVAPAHQGLGYGARLLRHFMQQAQLRGASNFLLEVRSSNTSAIALYSKCGFTQYGQRRGYYSGLAGSEDAVLMQCSPISFS